MKGGFVKNGIFIKDDDDRKIEKITYDEVFSP